MSLYEKKQRWIDEIMDNFNFNRVAKAMKALEWEWHDAFEGVPTESEIRMQARHMLNSIDVVKTATSTGYYNTRGFVASGDYDDNNNLEQLTLVFQLFDYQAYDEL